MEINRALGAVADELARARIKFPDFRSPHEGAAIIREEHEEFWDEVKANNWPDAEAEVVQLAAMAVRYLVDLCE